MSVVVTVLPFVIYSVWCVGDGHSRSGAVPISSTACLEFGTNMILVFVLLSKRNVICLSVESKKNSIKAGKDIPCFLSCLIYNLCYWYWKKVLINFSNSVILIVSVSHMWFNWSTPHFMNTIIEPGHVFFCNWFICTCSQQKYISQGEILHRRMSFSGMGKYTSRLLKLMIPRWNLFFPLWIRIMLSKHWSLIIIHCNFF